MKKLPTFCLVLLLGLSLGDVVQTLGGAVYGDKYLKAIAKSREIAAGSKRDAVNTAVKAAEKSGWKPTVVSPERGYVLAERVADVSYAIVTRDYAYRLEVRLPGSGKGDASILITPPPGLISSKTMDQIADEYLDSLTRELAAGVHATAAPAAEKPTPPATLSQPLPPPAETAEAKPPAKEPAEPPPAAAPEVKEKKGQRTVIATAALNVRSGPGARSKIIAKLKKGEKVVKLAESGNRIRIKSASGVTGWVSGKLVKETK